MKTSRQGLAFLAAATVLSGCSTIDHTLHARANTALNPKPLTIHTRPVEVGMEIVGDAQAQAYVTRLLGLRVSGDDVNASVQVSGANSNDPLVKLAAYRAARSQQGDAFYVVRVEEKVRGIPLLVRNRTVNVYGKTLRLRELGMMSAERADKLYGPPEAAGSASSRSGSSFLGRLRGLFGL